MGDLFENILTETYVWERVQGIKEGKKMTWEQIAVALYQILDDIDSLDDACKENNESFRELVMKTQARKGRFMASFDGYTVQRVDEGTEDLRWNVYYKDPSQPGQLIQMKKVFVAPSEQVAMKQGGLLLRREAGPDHEFEVVAAIQIQPEETVEGTNDFMLPEEELVKFPVGKLQRMLDQAYEIASIGRDPKWLPVMKRIQRVIRQKGGKESVDEELDAAVLDAAAQELFGKDYEDLEDYDQQEAAREAAKIRSHKSSGRTYSRSDFFTTNYGRPNEAVAYAEGPAPCHWEVWAEAELQRAGLFDKDSDYEGMLGEAIMELVRSFSRQGHSGMSAAMTSEIFSRLSSWKPLTPLTDDPNEWMELEEEMVGYPEMRFQSRRDPSCFSGDGGKTYWSNDDECFKEVDENGITWHTGSPERFAKRTIHRSEPHSPVEVTP